MVSKLPLGKSTVGGAPRGVVLCARLFEDFDKLITNT